MKVFDMKLIRFLLAFLLSACNLYYAQASFLKNSPQKLIQPDGTLLNCFASGVEYHNWLHDSRNFTIIQDPVTGYYVYAQKVGGKLLPTTLVAGQSDPAKAGIPSGLNLDTEEVQMLSRKRFQMPALKGSSSVQTTGTINNIVIFLRCRDQPEYTEPISFYNSAFNSSGTVSMVEYFQQISNYQLTINTSFYPASTNTVVSYQDAALRNYYCVYNAVSNPIGYQNETERGIREATLLKNAIGSVKSQLEASGLDFDMDNDGKVDNICFIMQGRTEGWNQIMWPHMTALTSYQETISGARVWIYNFQLSQVKDVSVFCHEMLHSLNFPDLYRYNTTTVAPVGPWDIMALNSYPGQHPSIYLKQKYGNWIPDIPEIQTSGTYTLEPLSTNPLAGYKIKSPYSSSEYFIVEYRKCEGLFESALNGSGLVITRINTTVRGGNMNGPPDEVYVFRLNGSNTVNGDINAACFSQQTGRTSFNSNTNPACLLSDGSSGGIEITNVGNAGSIISFTVNFSSSDPILAVSPDFQSIPFAGGNTTFTVSNIGGGTMSWTATVTSGSSWIHITSGSSGSNLGVIKVTADANTDNSYRQGTLTVTTSGVNPSTKTVTVIQSDNPPILNVGPETQYISYTGGRTSFAVSNTNVGSLLWTAQVSVGSAWIHITDGFSGKDEGLIWVTVDASNESNTRTGSITVTATGANNSPKTVFIEQRAQSPVLNVLPVSRSVGYGASTATFEVANIGGGNMPWKTEMSTGSSWAHILSGVSGTNAGTITVAIDENAINSNRSCLITISAAGAGGSPKTVKIEQSPNPPVLIVSPDTQTVPFTSDTVSFSVSNSGTGTMLWSADVTNGASWAHVISGKKGSNAGTFEIALDDNTETILRIATITITSSGAVWSPKTVTIAQAGKPAQLADLKINHVSAKLSVITQPEEFIISLAIENIGGSPSMQDTIHFFLATAPSIDSIKSDLGKTPCEPIINGSVWETEVKFFSDNLNPGDYYFIAFLDGPDLNSETGNSNQIGICEIKLLSGIQTFAENMQFSVFPVPADNLLNLQFENTGNQVEQLVITDILGQIVYSDYPLKNQAFSKTINVSNWIKGSYNVTLYTKQRLFHKPIIIQ